MYFVSVLTLLCSVLHLASANPAPISTDSPKGAFYQGTIRSVLAGSMHFVSNEDGKVQAYVDLTRLPTHLGPFKYQVMNEIARCDDCSELKEVFNPYGGTEGAADPADQPVGDLSGKYGMVPGPESHTNFTAEYCSLNPANEAYLGGKSILISLNDGSPIACANIDQLQPPPQKKAAA